MRIIHSSDLPAVVLVKGRGIFAVAIPERLSSGEVLELARLVLSTGEYEEFRNAVEPCDDPGDLQSSRDTPLPAGTLRR